MASSKPNIIVGLPELLAQMQNIRSSGSNGIYAREMAKTVDGASKAVADIVEQEAPRGPTGNLKKSVEYGVFKKRAGKPIAGFVRIEHAIAPHAHLVEFGARGGSMPANPFFSRGVRKGRTIAESMIEDGNSAAIDKAIK